MIKIITENGVFEMRANGERIQLIHSGECKGEILGMQNVKKGNHGTFECCPLEGKKATKIYTTGLIKKIVSE